MKINNSTNGYCNLWVLGESGTGKSYLIQNLIKEYNFSNYNTIRNTDFDILLSEEEYNVKLHIQELRSLDKINFKYDSKFNQNPSIFILLFNANIPSRKEYEKELIKTIQNSFPDSLIYIMIDGKYSITNKRMIFNIGKNIRDTFKIDDLESDDFVVFRNILKNSIINLSTNRLEKIKSKIINCIQFNEKTLDLGKCSLTNLYEVPELFNCEHLETLILSNEWAEFENGKWKRKESENYGNFNLIGHIPKEIKRLNNLKTLIIGGDWNLEKKVWLRWRIKNITPILYLLNIEYLNISNNSIPNIPNLCKLTKLKVLHLNNNEIYNIAFDGEFSILKELYLSNNYLSNLNFINNVNFSEIKTLDFHGNKIKDLEPLKNLILSLNITNSKWEQNTINVAKNPLQKPPIEIVNIGRNAVINYFEELSTGKSFINKDVKVILVGNSEVGKTTLAKYLDNEKDLDKEHFSTNWLEERQISSKYIIENIKQKCNINLFDFGGHDYFHDTHHLFFSSNTIYILLWDEASNCLQQRTTIQKNSKGTEKEFEFQDFPLKYWLESIKHFIKEDDTKIFDFEIEKSSEYNSDVLIVQNKVYSQDDLIYLNNQEFKDLYPFIYDFIGVSIKEKRKVNYFDETLLEMLNKTKFIGARLLDYYGKTKDAIKKYNANPIININEFLDFCNSIKGVNITLEQSRVLADYLNQVGIILYYPNSINKDIIYINKKWVLEKVYSILEGLYEKDGEFDEAYLEEVFENTLTKDQESSILKLMIDFKIIFKNPYENYFIAPLYLPEKPIQLMDMFIDDNKKPYRKFLYNGYIHKNVILNIFQEYGEYVVSDKKGVNIYYYYWKNGLIVKDPASNEIVKIVFNLGDDEGNASIDLYKINCNDDTSFVFQIIKSINDINEKYDVYEMITIDGHNYIPLSIIYENEEKDNWTFLYNEKYYKLTNFKKYLKKPTVMKKIFISYSKKDLKLVNKFIEHLASLQLDGKVSYWYCSELEAGSEWNQEIQSNFEDSDIICFMVSPNFMKTKYIHEHEIARAFEMKKKNPNLKIVPIILDFCRWTTSNNNLGQYTALPYTALPVVDFANQNKAWYIIEECLRIMIEKDLNPEGENFFREHLPQDILKIYEGIVDGSVNKKN
jgi:internalin A